MATTVGAVWVDVLPSMKDFASQLRKNIEASAKTIGDSSGDVLGRSMSASASRHGTAAGKSFGQRFASAADSTITRAVRTVGNSAGTTLVASLAGSATALTAALAPATGALLAIPAAAGVAGAAVGTLAVGVYGVGDAMAAVAEGDAEKLEEALDKLSPKAQEFVRAFDGVAEQFSPIRQAVQDRLFDGLDSQLRTLADGGLPVLESGMGEVASSLNGVAAEAARAAGTPLFRGQVADIFTGTATATDAFRGSVEPLMTVLAELVNIGLPLTTRFIEWSAGGLETAAAFLSSERGAEAMSDAVDRAVGVLSQLWDIGGNLSVAMGNIFGAAADDGASLLDTIEQLTAEFATWTASAQGQEQLNQTFSLLNQIFTDLLMILPDVAQVVHTVVEGFNALPGPVQETATQALAWSIVLAPLLSRLGSLAPAATAVVGATRLLGRGFGALRQPMSLMVQGFQSAQVAQSAFSGRMGSLGGLLRRGWDGAANATRAGATAVANAGRAAWSGLSAGATAAANGLRTAGAAGAGMVRTGLSAAANAARTAGAAALSSARSWGALAAAQTRSAVTAARARAATIATAVAQRAVRLATIAWTGVQWALNAALNANPIGLVVLAIAALIGAAVLAYNKIDWFRNLVDTAFRAIGDAATWAWDNALKPAFDAISNVITTYVIPAVMWLWQRVFQPAFAGIGALVDLYWNYYLKPIFNAISWVIMQVVVPAVMWLWTNVFQPVFGLIGALLTAWWKTQVEPVFNALVWVWRSVIAPAAQWLWSNVISPVFSLIGGFFGMWWRTQVKPVLDALVWVWRSVIAPAAKWLWHSVIKPAWNGISSTITSVWENHIEPAFGALRSGVDRVKDAFETARDGIRTAWNKLRSITKAPISFMINTVYNKGIVGLWNKVADKVPGFEKLEEFHPKGFDRGGILPGSSTWRQGDDQLVPMRKGEGVYVSEAMRDPYERARLYAVNRAAMRGQSLRPFRDSDYQVSGVSAAAMGNPAGGYAKGGIVGEWMSKRWDEIAGGLKAWASRPLDKLRDAAADRFGTAGFPGIPYRMTAEFRKRILDKFGKEDAAYASSLGGGADSWAGLESASARLRRAATFARAQHGKPYIWGGAGPRGYDCSGFMGAIENSIRGVGPYFRRYSTHSFRGGAPSGWVQGLRSPFTVGITHAGVGHTAGTLMGVNVESRGSAGVVVGSRARGARNGLFSSWYGFKPVTDDSTAGGKAKGGIVGLYDNGGYLQPGLSLVANATGRPEPVLTDAQWRALRESRRGGEGAQAPVIGEYHQHLHNGEATFAGAAEDLVFDLRKARRGGVFAGRS